MITVVGRFFTDTISSMEMEEELWKQLCNAYNVDELILVDSPHTMKLSDRNGYTQYETMEEALANVVGQKVFLEPIDTAIENDLLYKVMKHYEYPTDAVFVFGASFNNNVKYINPEDDVLSIQMPNDVRGVYGMNICAMVLRDRWLKSQ